MLRSRPLQGVLPQGSRFIRCQNLLAFLISFSPPCQGFSELEMVGAVVDSSAGILWSMLGHDDHLDTIDEAFETADLPESLKPVHANKKRTRKSKKWQRR